VIDVASAIMASLKDDGASMGKIYELGGPQIMTVHELVCFHSLSTLLHDYTVAPHIVLIEIDCHTKSNMEVWQ
jgi:hypothetical protein